MDALDCLRNRRSIRCYNKRKINLNILKDIVDCARLAPSAKNIQPWEFIAVTKKDTLQKIANKINNEFIADASACIVVVCRNVEFYLEDGSAASENILLAARAYDIGSCWIAGDKKPYANDVLKLLGVPTGYKLINILSLGYCDKYPDAPAKRTLKDVLHMEKF